MAQSTHVLLPRRQHARRSASNRLRLPRREREHKPPFPRILLPAATPLDFRLYRFAISASAATRPDEDIDDAIAIRTPVGQGFADFDMPLIVTWKSAAYA